MARERGESTFERERKKKCANILKMALRSFPTTENNKNSIKTFSRFEPLCRRRKALQKSVIRRQSNENIVGVKCTQRLGEINGLCLNKKKKFSMKNNTK